MALTTLPVADDERLVRSVSSRSHPRKPLPDTLTWESSWDGDRQSRALAGHRKTWSERTQSSLRLDDVNLLTNVGPMIFDNSHPSGRVDLVRTGNTITVTTRGVAGITLLLSPDAFDFAQPLIVLANGRVRVQPGAWISASDAFQVGSPG